MPVTITARHFDLPDPLRDRAGEVAQRLEARAGRDAEVAILFDLEADTPTAEIRFRVVGLDALHAVGTGDDHRSALDRAEEKLRRQLEKPTTRRLRNRKSTEMDRA